MSANKKKRKTVKCKLARTPENKNRVTRSLRVNKDLLEAFLKTGQDLNGFVERKMEAFLKRKPTPA
jgi:uncharacterized protein (DUF4415 family)